MSSHEVHQIYFEKYLRKKMSGEEKATFEQRLEDDLELKRAFEHYKIHRKKYLKEIIEDELSEQKSSSRINNMLYLLVSVICIIITAVYYTDNRKIRNVLLGRQEFENMPLTTRIPYIIKKPPLLTTQTKNPNFEINETTDPSEAMEDYSIAEFEHLLADTVYKQLPEIHDSTYHSASLNVELWYSPLGFRGYRYNGVLLQLYGVNSFSDIELYYENADLWLNLNNQSIALRKDFNYHKF
jgi:hypothetical protein